MDNKLSKEIAQGNGKKTRDANKRNVNISIDREKKEKDEQAALNKKQNEIDELNSKAFSIISEAMIKKQKELNLSNRKFAQYLGMGASVVGRYLNRDRVNLKLETVLNLSRILKLSVDNLFQNKDEYNALMRNLYIHRNIDEEKYIEFTDEVNDLFKIRAYAYDISPDKEDIKAIEDYENKILKVYDNVSAKKDITSKDFLEKLSETIQYNRR
jgi:transcriptional regulator with XRE-family HTH domain